MQWIKHKKEERMAVAGKVIGAVRLGLVDIRVVIEELDTEEMKRVPEVYTLMCETLVYNFMPSRNLKFAAEKTKTRSTSPVVIAVLPGAQMQYFGVEGKTWKPLASTIPAIEATECYCAASAGNNLYVAGYEWSVGYYIYRYNTEGNVWEKMPHSCGGIKNLCIVDDYMYAIRSNCSQVPQRYSFAKCQWQTFAKVNIMSNHPSYHFYNSGVTILHSKVYVLYGSAKLDSVSWRMQSAGLHCFDPVKNEWEEKAKTRKPHYGSSLFVVNNRIYVAGGYDSINISNGSPLGNPALVEAYYEDNTWSVVEQKHIPPGNPNAVEIEGKVFFIVKHFPVDSGIRIPPGELYPVHLGEYENLAKIDKTAVLCYLPVKRESLKSE